MAGTCRAILKYTGVIIVIFLLLQLYIMLYDPSNKYTIMRLQMLLVLQTIVSYGSYYIYRAYTISKLWNVVTICTISLSHFSFLAQYLFLSDDPSILVLIPFLGFSLHVFLILGTLAADIGTFLCIPFTMKISVGYQKFKLNVVPICAVILTIWSYVNTILPPQHSVIHVPVRGLAPELDNFHILQLSDVHVGPTTGKSFVNWLVEEANTHNPDIVAITGDLADSSVKNLKFAVKNLKNLKSKYGVFFVTGNHEYYTSDVDNWLTHLKSLSITTLHNEHSIVSTPDGPGLCVVGIDDPQAEKLGYTGHGPDPVSASSGCPPDIPLIMLAHQPKAAKLTIKMLPRVDLILSGHTHGGQFFPVHIPVWLVNPFFAGLYHPAPYTYVYVSRGLRFYGAPCRLFAFPEYTSIYLHVMKETS